MGSRRALVDLLKEKKERRKERKKKERTTETPKSPHANNPLTSDYEP